MIKFVGITLIIILIETQRYSEIKRYSKWSFISMKAFDLTKCHFTICFIETHVRIYSKRRNFHECQYIQKTKSICRRKLTNIYQLKLIRNYCDFRFNAQIQIVYHRTSQEQTHHVVFYFESANNCLKLNSSQFICKI